MESFATACLDLQKRVCEANLTLHDSGLIVSTFGNVSEKIVFDQKILVCIKPSGLSYSKMKSKDMVLMDENGNTIQGQLRPSTDTPTHLVLYKHMPDICGVTHTHSTYASAWAQAEMEIPALGTTHADYARCSIPCTEPLLDKYIEQNYEENTGVAIIERLKATGNLDSKMVLVRNHGPFAMGKSAMDSVESAILLEEIARIAFFSKMLNPNLNAINPKLHDKHYGRKHGGKKYYGQN